MNKQKRKHANSLQKIVSNHTKKLDAEIAQYFVDSNHTKKLDAEIAQYFVDSNTIINSPPVLPSPSSVDYLHDKNEIRTKPS
jgi:hypothetical protein